MMTATEGKSRSTMIFSCGPNEADRKVVPAQFYRKDEYGCHYYKLTAPLFVRLQVDGVVTTTKVTGPVVFTASGEEFWGGEKAKDFRSKVVEDPTYRVLLGAAKTSQKVTCDMHHAFIEGVYFKGYEEIDGRPAHHGVGILQ